MKLPFLVGHFQKHKIESGISLPEFLKEHYDLTHSDDDLPEDNQLPFNDSAISGMIAIVPVQHSAIQTQGYFQKNARIYKIYFPVINEKGIFHPPRIFSLFFLNHL